MALLRQEKQTLIKTHGKYLWLMRYMISHGTHWLTGIQLPPHERLWLYQYHGPYRENTIVASRGTSKSFLNSVAGVLKVALHKGVSTLLVSASGFRGGKLLFDDLERLFTGKLKSQKLPGSFLQKSVSNESGKVIRREPDRWTIQLGSQSAMMTVPTNNPDNLRGIRANEVITDERNTFDGEIVGKVIRPMLNVGVDFLRTAKGSEGNKLTQVSTIDYTFRDWVPEIQGVQDSVRKEYEAFQAMKQGDWKTYHMMMDADDGALRTSSFSYSRLDYTDLIVPEVIVADETAYQVKYPLPQDLTIDEVRVYDEQDKTNYFYTYPVNKLGLESPLRSGKVDIDLWLAEQRNCFISTSGNVFPAELIHKSSELPIYKARELHKKDAEDFFAPILYTCEDPCVMGVDYARESDELAICIIRLGELSEFDRDLSIGKNNGRRVVGKTPWNSVIWAETWKKWTAEETADHLRQLYKRYNILNRPGIAPGIGLDKGGGGSAVRDQLAMPSVDKNKDGTVKLRMFDHKDDDYKHMSAIRSNDYWGGLELISASNQKNLEWTMAAKAAMQNGNLYLAYSNTPIWAHQMGLVNDVGYFTTDDPRYHQMRIGYEGVRRLKSQLTRLQMRVSDSGVIRFGMPGRREADSGKKDLYSAFIYACYMMRQHQVLATTKDRSSALNVAPLVVDIRQRRPVADIFSIGGR